MGGGDAMSAPTAAERAAAMTERVTARAELIVIAGLIVDYPKLTVRVIRGDYQRGRVAWPIGGDELVRANRGTLAIWPVGRLWTMRATRAAVTAL